ncbi:MAG: FliM/FliN family flagellar motor switch protein [Burkholderiales bacterium]|nr:FliM/FliN family flagellar motor switch protein [Burkholderiales bacterium]
MAVRNFVLLKQRDIIEAEDRARTALYTWLARWCGSHVDTALRCSPMPAADHFDNHGTWSAFAAGGQSSETLWCHAPAGFERQLQAVLFDHDDASLQVERHRDSALAQDVAHDAASDLTTSILSALAARPAVATGAEGARPDDTVFRPYSGVALVTATVGNASLSLLLPLSYLPKPNRPATTAMRAALAPLPEALQNIAVRLDAQLGEIELPVAQLLSLAQGDVIRLPIRLDQELTLRAGDTTLCHAHLGQSGGCRALELSRSRTS